MGDVYLTRAGHAKLIQDMEELRRRKVVLSGEIAEAREKGDLKENAEFHSAKDKLAEVMNRIAIIQSKLEKATIIDEVKTPKDTVSIGVRVTLKEVSEGIEMAYTLVGEDESDPSEGRISVYSPLAQGLLGRKTGEEVAVDLPAGKRSFRIIKTEPAL